ncbi:glycoside hydrolase family 127 protein [Allosphingosinicella deserti]|uniref:Glycoside hydrolase family 127 protein n=1 Tax=Allosphingosinicella deserti TaxID=2116704 RepID=A0A2P7QRT4_9SPHN|nr:glycoside hydrolase family 127 protein [Sphingomonas deserti]PSJ40672.1 glycoside hydrolase family 127 protein [Sphingomonas deserti]
MLSRRTFLASASALALAGPALAAAAPDAGVIKVRPLPLSAVRLKPSPYADAVAANRRFLLALEPGRLLHNFHKSAGLAVQGALYGGWEARGIAGHSLGHYLSACSLLHAQTGDPAVRGRVVAIVAELARCQAAHGDGYAGGTTVERDGKVVDGKIVFEEIRKGDIRTSGFDINGGWVPLYTWHKVHAGLIDAHRFGNVPEAMPVMIGLADYLGTILEGLSDDQLQKLLAAEYGGLNDAYAETYALTGNRRYLALAERIRDRKILDPLSEGRNILPGLHANTQIPKLIGLARLHELTGDPRQAAAARFFHRTVVGHHSYVIGGNSEREHFGKPDTLSPFITDRTCEACNSYNMLKLTRHLFSWQPDAGLFDEYERTHLNHILAHQHPKTGMFAYFMPLTSGGRRTWSTLDDSFWCCVGSGMESHAKHGESIYWTSDDTLLVNLFIPSTGIWEARGMSVDLDTSYPFSDRIALTLAKAPRAETVIALRIPGWCAEPAVSLNGKPVTPPRENGYAMLKRRWRAGDRIELRLPMTLRTEATPDNPDLVAFLHGPVVLAADLGPAEAPFEQMPPALVASNALARIEPVDPSAHVFRAAAAVPRPATLRPFFTQYDRRTAVYFPRFGEAQWREQEAGFVAAQAERRALEARTIDLVHLGEMQPERDHAFRSNQSDLISFEGRSGRQVWWGTGNYLEVAMDVKSGPLLLRAVYWGEEVDKNFTIAVDGTIIAEERRKMAPSKAFVSVDYPIPEALIRGKAKIVVRIETRGSDAPVYELRTLRAAPPPTAT